MIKIVFYRYYLIGGFAVYYAIVLLFHFFSLGFELMDIIPRLLMIPVGMFGGFLENLFVMSRSFKRTRDYGVFQPIFLFLLVTIALIGPIVVVLFSDEAGFEEIAGLSFVVAGMGLASRVLLVDKVVKEEKM